MNKSQESTVFGGLEKWFPLQGERLHSLYFWNFQKQNREGGENKTTNQSIYPRF